MSRDALVVGISTYQYLPGLGAPGRDAEAVAHQLETYGDFRVARLPEVVQDGQLQVGVRTPVTLAQLETALVQLFKPKGKNIPHTALFYFSGHGLQKEAGIQEGYLATSEVNPQSHFYGLSLFWLRRLLQESPVRQRIVLLDCCHSGEILNFLEADPGARSGTDRLFMAASREYESAYESLDGTYSVFTQALLGGLDPRRLPNGVVSNYALTDWVSTALKGEVQQPLFENSGSEITLTRCEGALTVIQSAVAQDICPYRGLECFDEMHADYFFGREDLTDQLLNKLKHDSFLAVVGASGSGKSSLVRAGFIHRLRQGRTLSGSDRWQIKLITPTDQPLKSLASAFISPNANAVERAEQLRRAEMFLQDGGTGLSQLVRASLMSAGKDARMVLVIDQFEEVFTLCQGPHAERERHRFFNCLLAAISETQATASRQAGQPAHSLKDYLSVVIVLRADFFSKCSLYSGLAEKIEQNLVMAKPLTYEQIKASILKPAEKVGLICEPSLVYNILLDIVGAPGELPLLQYTLLELWQRRQPDPKGGAPRLTLDAYTELGGVRGTLQKRADEIFYSLSIEEQQVAKRIFIALTQLGEGTEDTRRRILKSELVSPQFSSDLVDRVIEKLVAAKLIVTSQIAPANRQQESIDQRLANMSTALRLAQMSRGKGIRQQPDLFESCPLPSVRSTLEQDCQTNILRISQTSDLQRPLAMESASGQVTVDIAHEALIRNWTLLQGWLDENREVLRRQRQIERAAREWDSANQPRSPEFLLHGSRLLDAEDYLNAYPHELSALAQHFLAVSREESHHAQRELRALQTVIPFTLLIALGVTFNQYYASLKSQAEKDYQLQVATSRQWAAIAQSILQERDSDPSTALLISRLAAERGQTYEAQVSLRAALQKLRLQARLEVNDVPIRQALFSHDQQWLATLDQEGTVRIWSLATQTVTRVLPWSPSKPEGAPSESGSHASPQSAASTNPSTDTPVEMALSPDSQSVAVIAQGSTVVKVWSLKSGQVQFELGGFQQPIQRVLVSPDGRWIVAASDRAIRIWDAATGHFKTQVVPGQPITRLAFSPNGQWLATVSEQQVYLWQTANWTLKHRLPQALPIHDVTFSRDEQTLASVGNEGQIRLWHTSTGKLLQQITVPLACTATAAKCSTMLQRVLFSPDGTSLAVIDSQQQVWLWQKPTGQLHMIGPTKSKKRGLISGLPHLAFSPDSQQLVTTQPNTTADTIQIWDIQTRREIAALQGHKSNISSLRFNTDGSLIATTGDDGTTYLWAAKAVGEFPVLATDQPIRWIAFRQVKPGATSAALRSLATLQPNQGAKAEWMNNLIGITADGKVRQWSLGESEAPTHTGLNPASTLSKQDANTAMSLGSRVLGALQFAGQHLQSINRRVQHRLTQWGASTQYWAPTAIRAASFVSPRPPLPLIMATQTLSVPATHQLAGQLTQHLRPKPTTLASVTLSPSGNRIATVTGNHITVWQVEANQLRPTLHIKAFGSTASGSASNPTTAHTTSPIQQLVFSPDGRYLLGVHNQTLWLWNVETGQIRYRLAGHKAAIEHAQFSPDGRLIVSASQDRTARIWAVDSGQAMLTLSPQTAVRHAEFSPNSQQVVIAGQDGTARVFQVATGNLQVILAAHQAAILNVKFSPDGQTIATASADGTARLWDAVTGSEQALLRPPGKLTALREVQFSPDNRYVATLAETGELYVWVATWDGLLELARDRSLRQLQPDECLRYLRLPPNTCPALEAAR